MPDEPKTDAEAVEHCRRMQQENFDRALQHLEHGLDDERGSVADMLNATGRPQQSYEVQAVDLTEIGRFDLVVPDHVRPDLRGPMRQILTRHIVYRHRDGRVFALGFPRHCELKANGRVRILGLIEDPAGQN